MLFQVENAESYRNSFGEARKVRSKGRRLKKPMRNALSAVSSAFAFSAAGADMAVKRLSGEITGKELSELEKIKEGQVLEKAVSKVEEEE